MVPSPNEFFIKYCKFINKIKFFKKIGNSFRSKKLSQISNYLNKKYNLLPNEVLISSIATFFLLFIPLTIIFIRFNFILGIIFPIFVSYLVSYKIFNYPINNYNQIQQTLIQYSDFAFQDFLIILNTTKSIFDAISFISEAKYPVLSERFQEMISSINIYGESPEFLINSFIKELPNGYLKERLLSLMATKFQPSQILEQLESLAGEKKFEYETVTRQLESKLIIIVGVCLFFPILTALFISFLGPTANFISFFMIPLFIIFSAKFKSGILRTHFELFGESSIEKDEIGSNNSDFLEFLNFLTFFGNELKRGIPQEMALLQAYLSYQGSLKNSIKDSINEIYNKNESFKNGWNKLKILIKSSQIHFLIDIINRMVDKSSLETGIRLISIIQQLKANRELIQERKGIIKAQQFKIKFLTFIVAAILGLIAGLTPLLIQIFTIISNPEPIIQFNFFNSWPLSFSLLIMTIYDAYFLTGLVQIHRPIRYSFWGGLLFIIFWYLAISLLI